jgi:hypothetical protein
MSIQCTSSAAIDRRAEHPHRGERTEGGGKVGSEYRRLGALDDRVLQHSLMALISDISDVSDDEFEEKLTQLQAGLPHSVIPITGACLFGSTVNRHN